MSHPKKKKKTVKKKQAAQKSSIKNKFSAAQPAGKPVSTCPLKCNLKLLKILEPKGGNENKTISRGVQITALGKAVPGTKPVTIAGGGKFQITAPSKLAKEPRELQLSVVAEATCPGKKHPLLAWKDSTEEKSIVGTSGEAKFFRQTLACDGAPGFFSILNGIFAPDKVRGYLVTATSCGNPPDPKGISAPQIIGIIEVFPADTFEAEIEMPAPAKKDVTDKKSANWTTARDEQGEEVEKERKEASDAYKASDPKLRGAWGTQKEYSAGFADKKKEDLGYEDREPEGAKFKLTQKDGPRTITANPKEIIDLYNLVRATEAGIKKVQEWIEDIQIGPGASFKVDLEFFVLTLKAEWGYEEFEDERVFLAITGTVSCEVIKGSVEAFFGFRSAGLADVLAFIKGEGSIKLSAAIKHDNPDKIAHVEPTLAGEFVLSGGVQGQAMWIMKAEGKLKSGFSVEAKHMEIFTPHGLFKGELELKLAATQLILTASCWLIGSTAKTYELMKSKTWPLEIGKGS